MGKKKRPGVKSADSLASSSFVSTRSGLNRGMSTRSGISTKSGGKSIRSGGSNEWVDDNETTIGAGSTRPGMTKSAGQSMRSLLKSANSVGSGLGMGGSSNHSGHKISYKQKKARPGLAVAPQGISTMSSMSGHRQKSGLSRGLSSHSGMSTGSGHRLKKTSPSNSEHQPMKKQMSMRSLSSEKSKHALARSRSGRSLASGQSGHSGHSSGHSKRLAPEPPPSNEDYYDEFSEGDEYEEDMEQFEEDDQYIDDGQEETIIMPQTEEEIRQGLHTEQVTKGFFRKKVRSIKWYSADIDKVDAGNYEPGETIEEDDEEGSEYETDSDDDSEEQVVPDPWYIALGRGLLLLEKKGEETTPIKRWLRCLTWWTFLCDATAAIVSLVQFSGVQECCGQPIMNLSGLSVNWSTIIRYATIFYLILILLEVYPVLRRGFPFNIVNPLIGFLITFALFFDDSYLEALIMWCIETFAVLSEFAMYRVKIRQVNMRAIEIKKLMPKTTKKKEAWEDEDAYLKELHKARRKYYVLKQEQRMDKRVLQYLHLAVYMNIVMSSVVLMLILVIARNGGMCIVNNQFPNPFQSNPLEKCTYCNDPSEFCEECNDATETYQCYFPYE
ncbi:expressed unknown protein [Seminavis robusta]|uniref:Uncharacterized protein n=1 Tax=Seminavis robusta TaxID=568900 RepID=A0A9N8ESR1_9STRA|nr:expressed unknown protein [Seminavis robusta]|eukprot:Sro1848_g301480.1 n/a (611) ;mRNA; f:17984-19816